MNVLDEARFTDLSERHRRELQVHSYRMLGNMEQAEDAVQEALLRAWKGRASFDGGPAARAWLYRIVTTTCFDVLRAARRRPEQVESVADVPWLQPYPDVLLDAAEGPEEAAIRRETVELAYLAVIQLLPARQRAVLLLRDVQGYSAAETAAMLEMSLAAVTSALQRARATLAERASARDADWSPSGITDGDRALLAAFIDAHERQDMAAGLAVIREDIRVAMPPNPGLFTGRDAVAGFMAQAYDAAIFGDWRLLPTAANRMPAAASYLRRAGGDVFLPFKLDVLRTGGGRIAEITTFDASLFGRFGLPSSLPSLRADDFQKRDRSRLHFALAWSWPPPAAVTPGGKDDVQATADAVRISVLGPLEVTDPAGHSVRVGGHRVRALLILLALDAGRVVPAQALIERLWGGAGEARPADAANALQSLVSRLRVALRQAGVPDRVLESCPAGYRLAVQPHAVDAIAFESQARAGRQALARGAAQEAVALLRPALGAWRGSALTDVAGEEFAFAPAARLAELRAAATLDRIEADLALGAADAALVGELRELTAADELAERPAALLMRALAATGRQAEALGVYQQVRDRLADRLGVDPSPWLEQAYLAILRQEIPQAAVPVASGPPTAVRPTGRPAVPPAPTAVSTADRTLRGARTAEAGTGVRCPPTSFVGRDDEMAGLLKRLAVERLVTLTGPGGVGKTRLAAETAARLDGPAWFAELAPVTDPAKVPYAVLDALGLRERSIARHAADAGGDAAGRLTAFLADRDAVLVLDNCEHVIDAAAALVARLLADCPRVRFLATSLEPLQIPGEVLQVVAPLAAPNPGDRSAITSGNPAVRLFADRAAAVVDGFELSEANATAVARICQTLDGMPLAIELAAPWLRTLTPAQLAGRLDDRFALLTGGSRTALPRHQTLRAVVDWSWNLLIDQERALARRLAVFPAGATLAAAERVCAGPGPLTAGAVLPTLAGLVGKSILSRATAGEDGEARYQMLDTVRAYCLDRLAEAGEDTQVRDAAARYYLDLVETADPLLRTSAQVRWFRVLAAEQGNVNAAIRWVTAKGDAASALRFVRSLGYSWVQRGHGEADGLCRAVLRMDPPPLTRELAEARVICALLAAGWMWDIDSVREPLTEALAAVDRFDDGSGTCHPLVAVAGPVLLQYDGANDLAMARFEWYANSPDQWMRAIGQASLSSYAFSLGTLDGAEQHCRAGLAELRALGEHWGISMALTQLAEFTELRADHAASIAALAEAAAIGREIAAWGDLSYVEARLALIRARSGDLATARAEMTRVERAVAVRGGHMDIDRWIAFMRAELAWREGDYAESARRAAVVLADVQGLQAPWWQSLRAQVKTRLAAAVLMQGDRDRCGELLGEALDDAAAWTDHPALAVVLDACAVHLLTGGDPLLAARLLGAAHAVRGAFDESSPDAPPARDAARAALGPRAYMAAYASSRDLRYEQAAALGREALATR